MAAKKTVAEKDTVSAIALVDINIIWESKVYAAEAFSQIELPDSLYEHLSGLRTVAGTNNGVVETPQVEELTVPEPVVESETSTEEVE